MQWVQRVQWVRRTVAPSTVAPVAPIAPVAPLRTCFQFAFQCLNGSLHHAECRPRIVHLIEHGRRSRDHRFPAFLKLVTQAAEARGDAVHQAGHVAVFRIHVWRDLLRVHDEERLELDEPFVFFTTQRQRAVQRARRLAMHGDVAVDVVDHRRIERLLLFEERRHHRPRMRAQPSEPASAFIRLERQQFPSLVQRSDLEFVVRRRRMWEVPRRLDHRVQIRQRLVVEAIGFVSFALQTRELGGAPPVLSRHRADGTPNRGFP